MYLTTTIHAAPSRPTAVWGLWLPPSLKRGEQGQNPSPGVPAAQSLSPQPACVGALQSRSLGESARQCPPGRGRAGLLGSQGGSHRRADPQNADTKRDPRGGPTCVYGELPAAPRRPAGSNSRRQPEPCPRLRGLSGSWRTSHCRVHPGGGGVQRMFTETPSLLCSHWPGAGSSGTCPPPVCLRRSPRTFSPPGGRLPRRVCRRLFPAAP